MTAPKNSGDGWIVPKCELSKTQRTELLKELKNNQEAVHAVESAVGFYRAIQQSINDDPGPADDKIQITDISKHARSLSQLLERLPLTAKDGLEQGFFVTNRHFVDLTNVKENVDQLARAAKWYCDATGQRSDGGRRKWERPDLIRRLGDIYRDAIKKPPPLNSLDGPFTRIVMAALDAAEERVKPISNYYARELIQEVLTPAD